MLRFVRVLTIPLALFTSAAVVSPRVALALEDKAAQLDASCREAPADPYEIGWRIASSSHEYGGQCADLGTRRPVTILSEDADAIEFANFYHRGEFWKARWRRADAPWAQLVILHFNAGVPLVRVAHVELRLHFAEGLRLTPQSGDPNRSETVDDVMVDWDATFPKGKHYDLISGFRENLPIVGRITSHMARVAEDTIAPNTVRRIEQYRLRLTSPEAASIFEWHIRESARAGLSLYYWTLFRNCVTQQFKMLDRVLRGTRPQTYRHVWRFGVAFGTDPVAGPTLSALLKRGVIDPQEPPVHVAAELGMQEEKGL